MAAARTPASIKEESIGSRKLLIVKFTDVVTDDTWVSGLGATPIAHWTAVTTVPGTQTNCGSCAALAAGTFTFDVDEDTQDVTLFVLV
jgi:hypothetical protein